MSEPKRIDLTEAEFEALLNRLENDCLTEQDRERIAEWLKALIWMGDKLQEKELSMNRLKRLFGVKTESAKNLFGNLGKGKKNSQSGSKATSTQDGSDNKSVTGHGRNGKSSFPEAQHIFYPHESLKPGDRCPKCDRGNVYSYGVGSVLRLIGQSPIVAVVHEPEKLRCNSCGEIFTASLPQEVGTERTSATANSMVALLRYGAGMPFYRNERLQEQLKVPLPDASQWDMVEKVGNSAFPIFKDLKKEAAQKELIHYDDTVGRILSLKKELVENNAKRKGLFTTGIVAKGGGKDIALFFTGNQHAGENLTDLLSLRDPKLPSPKLMCDALSSNKQDGTDIVVGKCLDHGRRNFVDIATAYQDEAQYFIERIGLVYHYDSNTETMSDAERLSYHKTKSLPIMEELKLWCETELQEHKVEPNSSLGKAMKYFIRHYPELIKFTEVPGMPISNSEVERLLKTAVLHRKNSLFYRNKMGAQIGDILMSVIQTARRAGVNVFTYLTAIQEYALHVAKHPDAWLPWNFEQTLATLQPTTLTDQ